jgi:hypothetical protein
MAAGDFRIVEWMYDLESDPCADETQPAVVNLPPGPTPTLSRSPDGGLVYARLDRPFDPAHRPGTDLDASADWTAR